MEFLKFHGTWLQHQIPWNPMESLHPVEKFHGISWNYWEFHAIRRVTKFIIPIWKDPWNSMWFFFSNNDNMPLNYLKALCQGILNNFKKETEYLKDFTSMGHSIDCHGTLRTLQPGDPHFKRSQVSVDFHGIFHGIEWVSRVPRSNITKFHGIPWNQQDPISNDTMVPWNIPWNSMERWGRQINCHQIPSNAMELGDRNFKWYQCFIGL